MKATEILVSLVEVFEDIPAMLGELSNDVVGLLKDVSSLPFDVAEYFASELAKIESGRPFKIVFLEDVGLELKFCSDGVYIRNCTGKTVRDIKSHVGIYRKIDFGLFTVQNGQATCDQHWKEVPALEEIHCLGSLIRSSVFRLSVGKMKWEYDITKMIPVWLVGWQNVRNLLTS